MPVFLSIKHAPSNSNTKSVNCNTWFVYQRVFEGDQVLPFPFALKHVGEVLRACTENTSVGREHLPVDQELDVTVLTLLQQPEARRHK